jgi:hypothetical protein
MVGCQYVSVVSPGALTESHLGNRWSDVLVALELFVSIVSARDVQEQRLIENIVVAWCRDAEELFWGSSNRRLAGMVRISAHLNAYLLQQPMNGQSSSAFRAKV